VAREGGALSIVRREELVRMNFPELPEGLVVRPTLVWQVENGRAGDRQLELEYLTSGINWHAEYVGVVTPASDRLTLSAWVSIDNRSGTSYPDARLKLVAGDVHRARDERMPKMATDFALQARAPSFEERAFFEYHLYTLQRRTTVRDKEIKQIALFEPAEARATRNYAFDGARDPNVRVMLKVKNSADEGLGMPLPKGTVRVYQQDTDESLEFVGEDRIAHTPRDEEIELQLGNAFDIAAERRSVARERVAPNVNDETIEVKLRNHKDARVTVTVIEHLYGYWKVREETHEHRQRDANTIEFDVAVPADQETVLRYEVRVTQ
jgi:hypothetical protein